MQRRVDLRDRTLTPPQPGQLRWNHLGIVENKRIPPSQQRREVEDNLILEWLIGLYDEQTRSVPRLCRAHCDPLIGELKIKEIDAHGALRPCRVSGSYVSSNTHGDDGIRIAHRPIIEFLRRARRYDQKPCRVTRVGRAQSDALRRQVEIEKDGSHECRPGQESPLRAGERAPGP